MPKHDKIQNEELRGLIAGAYTSMRAGQGGDAVRVLSQAYLRLLELKPELLGKRVTMGRGSMLAALRWPMLGANLKWESLRTGKPEIEIVRESFAVSEAMTYYEYTVQTAIEADA